MKKNESEKEANEDNSNPGSSMKDFQILNELGKGSCGMVYKVKSLLNQKEYVIKKINIQHMKEKHQKKAQREVQILKQVLHPNIIRYYNSFHESNSLFIVMEYADGGDLQKVLFFQYFLSNFSSASDSPQGKERMNC